MPLFLVPIHKRPLSSSYTPCIIFELNELSFNGSDLYWIILLLGSNIFMPVYVPTQINPVLSYISEYILSSNKELSLKLL